MKSIISIMALAVLIGVSASPAVAQVDIFGFVEAGSGVRLADRDDLPDYLLRETRLQLKGDMYGDVGEAHFKIDMLADQVAGNGADLAIREGYVKFNAFADNLEVRAGRQPTTWGTGDLLFINDLFPKDWVSFFNGRDDEYLKGPSDAMRFGLFNLLPFTVDVVYTPQFTPDNLPSGQRLSFFAPDMSFYDPAFAGPQTPADELGNGETALRLSRYVGSWNWSLYGYFGFWKQPQGVAFDSGAITSFYHPELDVYGASTRGPLFGGVAWAEGGYYNSTEDADGDNPFIPNSETRAMAGYERQWWSDFTGGMQFYWEGMKDHDVAATALDAAIDQFQVANGGPREAIAQNFYLKDQSRMLLTLRLRQQFLYQTVTASVFAYYSPSDEDSYARASLAYDYSDQLKLTLGANMFQGNDERTMFGMNEDNDNLYGRVRFSF